MKRWFRFFWNRRFKFGEEVVYVTGWRSCIIDNDNGERKRVTFMLKAFGKFF